MNAKVKKDSWNLFMALSDIDDKFILEAMPSLSNENSPSISNVHKRDKSKHNLRNILPKLFLAAVLLALPANAMGDSSLYGVVAQKVENVCSDEQEIREICANVAAMHLKPEQVALFPVLKRNENGLIYGYGFTITDLVATPTDDGKWGYSYTKDLFMPADATPQERLYMMTNTRQLPIYENDGKTLIGHLTFGWYEPKNEYIAHLRNGEATY